MIYNTDYNTWMILFKDRVALEWISSKLGEIMKAVSSYNAPGDTRNSLTDPANRNKWRRWGGADVAT